MKFKALKIMLGMINTGDTNISEYCSRTVAIEVTGICRQSMARTSNYTIKVPYSRMSQTIQNINRMGGKIASVSLVGTPSVTETPRKTVAQPEPKRSGSRKHRNRK
ncbi:MAG: phycobilisome linker polypeptide [Waterburya sp.]